MRQKLPKSSRLRGYQSFTKVISQGRSLLVRPIRCYFVYDAEVLQQTNVGFGVTRDVGKASERNRIKRILREAFRIQKDLLPRLTGPRGSLKVIFLYVGGREERKARRMSESIHSAMSQLLPRIRQGASSPS